MRRKIKSFYCKNGVRKGPFYCIDPQMGLSSNQPKLVHQMLPAPTQMDHSGKANVLRSLGQLGAHIAFTPDPHQLQSCSQFHCLTDFMVGGSLTKTNFPLLLKVMPLHTI